MGEFLVIAVVSAGIILGPVFLFGRRKEEVEYEERPFLNGTISVPKRPTE